MRKFLIEEHFKKACTDCAYAVFKDNKFLKCVGGYENYVSSVRASCKKWTEKLIFKK